MYGIQRGENCFFFLFSFFFFLLWFGREIKKEFLLRKKKWSFHFYSVWKKGGCGGLV